VARERNQACGCSVSWDEECNGGKCQSGNQNGTILGWVGMRLGKMSRLHGDFWGLLLKQERSASAEAGSGDWTGLRDRRGPDGRNVESRLN